MQSYFLLLNTFHLSLHIHKRTNSRKMKKMISVMILLVVHVLMINPGYSAPTIPALYVFGDSLFDSGNNNLLPTLAKADFHPYGMNFQGGATGRFTNGRTVVDFIAEFLGLPYSPPYLNIERAVLRANQLTGLNFASGACGILSETGKNLGKCLNIEDQINLFERVVQHDLPSHYHNSDELSNYMSRSLFVISIGSNDYINNYLDTQHYDSRKRYSPQAFAQLLTNRLSLQLERLYKLGARKVIMFEIGPIGCIPSIARQFKHKGRCDEEINNFANLFNENLAKVLRNLTTTFSGSDFILGHAHWLGYDAVIHPFNYGLTDSTNPCCVTWLNGTSGCLPVLGAFACRNPEKHYFWDGYHLTEAVYRTIASRCFSDNSVCVPKSVRQLVLQI